MAADGLSIYPVTDLRGTALPDAVGSRGTHPIGACLHHTGGIDSRFTLTGHHGPREEPVSADVLISKSGARYLITTDEQYAYGVGVVPSSLTKRYGGANINEYLLSAELEYLPLDGPTFEQYDSFAEQMILWAQLHRWRWPFVIFGHYGIAYPPGRKYDPYLLDWGELAGRLLVKAQLANIGGL